MEKEMLVVAKFKEGEGKFEKFMQQPENQEAIKNSGHKQETSVMVVCSN